MRRVLVYLLPFAAAAILASADDLSKLHELRGYTFERAGSYDRTGANDDGNWENPVQAGETRTIVELEGPGIIKHIWTTISSREKHHLKKIVIRMYWDGQAQPAVEAPVGDFFGLGLGEYFLWSSGPLSVGSQRALNSFFPMPFRKSARITVTNEGQEQINGFYYNVDWERHDSLPDDIAYFHAEYRQAVPNEGWTDDWTRNGVDKVNKHKNPDGKDNYVFFEAEGRGHFVGVTHSILQNQGDWWGEGDEMMFIDNRDKPKIIGTGSEDYYLGAWCYGNCGINPFGSAQPTFDYQRYGNPKNGRDDRGARWMVYRFHTESPVPFDEYFKMTMEHGHGNHRSDNWYTVAYWYQQGEHKHRKSLPPVEERLPRGINTGGPTTGRP